MLRGASNFYNRQVGVGSPFTGLCKLEATRGRVLAVGFGRQRMYGRTFGERNFGQAQLGDKRRTKRLVALVDTMCRHPGGTLPDKFNHPPDLRAFYNLMNRPEVTHAVLIESHTAETQRRIADLHAGQVVLHLHDATELDFTSKTTLLDHLGQIGQGSRRGYICHNSLAVRADTGETLGLLSQILHHRADVPEGETTKEKREREDRESRLWIHGAAACGPVPAGMVGIDVSDSLSDTFEYMAYEVTQQRCFVLRAKENRKLETAVNGRWYLLDAVRSLPGSGQRQVEVLPSSKRQGRTATVKVAFAAVHLAVPRKHSGEYAKAPLPLWAVRIWEPNTPPGEDPLEWILLTNVPVANGTEAQVRADWYECRPIVEELHKGMKTGCGIETMQFEKIERLEPAIAVLSAVTTTLLRLRDAARAADAETRPAEEVVDPEYVEVLSSHYGKKLGRNPSVKQFYTHVARLGGHQNRKCDGFPGWITLWRGWMKLQSMLDGYRAALKKLKKCCKT
jgi:Transposase DNA-binding